MKKERREVVVYCPLLKALCLETPGALRRQLTEPDPIVLHDWNIGKDAYVALVRLALTQQGE